MGIQGLSSLADGKITEGSEEEDEERNRMFIRTFKLVDIFFPFLGFQGGKVCTGTGEGL